MRLSVALSLRGHDDRWRAAGSMNWNKNRSSLLSIFSVRNDYRLNGREHEQLSAQGPKLS
jgi:hypothetical protein